MNLSPFSFFLFDFADVISLPQDMNAFWQMAQLADMDHVSFKDAYWKYRRPYDLGQKGKDYWTLVTKKALSPTEVSRYVELDCTSWGRMNPVTIELLEKLRHQNKRLGLLSNLPLDLVNFLRKNFSFLELFNDVFFSAEIGLVKPDQEIYEYVLNSTHEKGPDILFFDDKKENLLGAEKMGIQTFLVTQESIKGIASKV